MTKLITLIDKLIIVKLKIKPILYYLLCLVLCANLVERKIVLYNTYFIQTKYVTVVYLVLR